MSGAADADDAEGGTPSRARPLRPARPPGAAGAEHRWRVPRKVPIGKLVVAAVVATLAVWSATEPWQWAGAAVMTAGLVAWAVRDLAVPVRVAADPAGVTVVTGFAHRQRLAWSQVERVRVDTRRRSRLLEVDAGERLYLFSPYEVDAELDEVAERLEALRTDAGPRHEDGGTRDGEPGD